MGIRLSKHVPMISTLAKNATMAPSSRSKSLMKNQIPLGMVRARDAEGRFLEEGKTMTEKSPTIFMPPGWASS